MEYPRSGPCGQWKSLSLDLLELQFLGFCPQKAVVGANLVCLSFLLKIIMVLKSLKYIMSFMLVFVCLYKVFIMFEICFYSVCGGTQYMWRSGGNFGELVPFFHLISPGDRAQVVKPGSRDLYLWVLSAVPIYFPYVWIFEGIFPTYSFNCLLNILTWKLLINYTVLSDLDTKRSTLR